MQEDSRVVNVVKDFNIGKRAAFTHCREGATATGFIAVWKTLQELSWLAAAAATAAAAPATARKAGAHRSAQAAPALGAVQRCTPPNAYTPPLAYAAPERRRARAMGALCTQASWAGRYS